MTKLSLKKIKGLFMPYVYIQSKKAPYVGNVFAKMPAFIPGQTVPNSNHKIPQTSLHQELSYRLNLSAMEKAEWSSVKKLSLCHGNIEKVIFDKESDMGPCVIIHKENICSIANGFKIKMICAMDGQMCDCNKNLFTGKCKDVNLSVAQNVANILKPESYLKDSR